MASLGHVAVGLAAGRFSDRGGPPAIHRWLGYVALSLSPDLDVIAFRLGIPYAAPFGHRGAAHSLLVAIGVGVLGGLVLRRPGRVGLSLALGVLVVASHGLLDALTDGGLGVAMAWPFSTQRWFAPFRPLPVAPLGTRFLSSRGLAVAMVELLWFAPLWIYALWPRRRVSPSS